MGDRLRLGLIGFGNWPRTAYAPILREMPDVEVRAVAARTAATCDAARDLISPGIRGYHNYHDLLADPDIEAVLIATPNGLHPEVAAWALKARKHVLLEAPFGENPAQVFPLLDTAEKADRVFQGDLELGYLPVVRRMSDLVGGGALGDVLSVSVTLWCNWGYGGNTWPAEQTRCGFFVWTGPWYLHLLDLLIGRLPRRVSAHGVRVKNGQLMDHGSTSLDYGQDLIGRFEYSLVAVAGLEIEVRIAGTHGEARGDLITGECRWRTADTTEWQSTLTPAAQPTHGFVGMRECLAGFVRAVTQGEPVLADVASCRRIHQVAFAVQRAADEGVIVDLPG
jgi:predicted dehydrogenase